MRWILVTAALLLVLNGCSGKKEEERRARLEAQCVTADWRAIGYEDGAKGYKTDRISRHRKMCAEFGIAPSLDPYLDGHAKGIAYYCQPQNGYIMGAKGRRYTGGCPAGQDAVFAAATDIGYGLYTRQKAVDDINKQIYQSRQRSLDLEHILTDKAALLLSPSLPPAERPALVIEIKQLTQEKAAIARAIPQMESNLGAAQHDLDAYKTTIPGRYSS